MTSQFTSSVPVDRSPSFQSNDDTATSSMPPSDKKIVSPPRSGPHGRFSHAPSERMTEPPAHPAHPSVNDDRPSPLHRGSPRFVSFQEQDGEQQQQHMTNATGDGSPRNYLTTDRSRKMINQVSPLTQIPQIYVEGLSSRNDTSNLGAKFKFDLSCMRVPDSPYPRGMGGSYDTLGTTGSGTRLRSNRGGLRALGRHAQSTREIPSPPRKSSFPVSTRGRGLCTSSRGRGRINAPRNAIKSDPEMLKGQHIPQNSMDILRLYRNESFPSNSGHSQANAKRQRVGNAPHEDVIVSR